MAYLDFGFGTGLSYKYDFNARHQRRRQNRADVLSEKRYEDQIAHRDEREVLKDERYTEELQHTRDTEAAEYAFDQSQLYNPPEYATRYGSKRTQYTQPLLEQIGDIENSPNFSSDPEKMKTLQSLRREVQNMPGEEGFKSAVQDYDQMVQDYKAGDIDAEEYRKQISEWQSYNKSEGIYGENGGTHYSYIPEEKFSMPDAVSTYMEGYSDIVKKSVFAGKDGDYNITSLSDEKLNPIAEEFYNDNKVQIGKKFDSLSENTKNQYGTGEKGEMAYARHAIETKLNLGSERIRDYASTRNGKPPKDNTNYFYENFKDENVKEGTNPYISDVLPIEDGKLKSNEIFFMGKGDNGYVSGTSLPITIPAHAELNISGGGENITEWIRGEDGQLFGKTRVWMKVSDYKAMTSQVSLRDRAALKEMGNPRLMKTGDVIKFTDTEGEEDFRGEEIMEFDVNVPFTPQGIANFNKHSSAQKSPYGKKTNTELEIPTVGDDDDVPPPPKQN